LFVSANELSPVDYWNTENTSSNAFGPVARNSYETETSSKAPGALSNGTANTSSKALGALAVAQRDMRRAQFCARRIVATLRRPRA